ncbi:MAG: hypothetical protein IAF02_03935 [Anaerolineae bacterium]|nr:hypothetical protein [Anaerolineae bacterium]
MSSTYCVKKYALRPTHYALGLTAVLFIFLAISTTACSSATQEVAAAISPTQIPLPTQAEVATVPPTETAIPSPTATEKPSSTPTHTPTVTPTDTPTATPSPTAIPPGELVNGLHVDEFVILPPDVQAHILEIYALGQEKERRPNAFSKLGDSSAASPDFLVRFDQRTFDLAQYAYLQETIDYYDKSFQRFGATLKNGLHATAVFAPDLINLEICDLEFDTDMLDCEFRLHNPSILLIALGTNDQSDQFEPRMEKIVNYTMERGIIPVLITKADRFEGEDNRNNISIRRLAEKYQLPLVDFDILANTLPNRGMQEQDNVHLTWYGPFEYTSPEPFERGYPMLNLATIMMLDKIHNTIQAEFPEEE